MDKALLQQALDWALRHDINGCATDIQAMFDDARTSAIAQPEQPQPDLRAILKDVVSVAIAQLYEQHTDDTLAEFPLKDLEVIVENTDPLRPQSVEKIYRRGFDAIYNAETAQPVPPALKAKHE